MHPSYPLRAKQGKRAYIIFKYWLEDIEILLFRDKKGENTRNSEGLRKVFSHHCNQFFHLKHLNFSINLPYFLPCLNCQKSCQGRGSSLYLPLGSSQFPAASYTWFAFSCFLLLIRLHPRKCWRKRCQDPRKDLIRARCAVVWEHFLWREGGAGERHYSLSSWKGHAGAWYAFSSYQVTAYLKRLRDTIFFVHSTLPSWDTTHHREEQWSSTKTDSWLGKSLSLHLSSSS